MCLLIHYIWRNHNGHAYICESSCITVICETASYCTSLSFESPTLAFGKLRKIKDQVLARSSPDNKQLANSFDGRSELEINDLSPFISRAQYRTRRHVFAARRHPVLLVDFMSTY